MITSIYRNYLQLAKMNNKNIPATVTSIFRFYKEKAKEEYEKALKESENTEDLDVVENLPEDISDIEKCPTCEDYRELRDYIKNYEFTRKIDRLFVHCTATRQDAKPENILKYWRNTMGWKNPGYHVLVTADKGWTLMAEFDIICNGVAGHNSTGVHVSYIGGINTSGKGFDNRTESQTRIIEVFIEEMRKRFPDIMVIGHNEVSAKACPSFKVKDEYPRFWTGLKK